MMKIIFCTLRDNKGATGGPGGVLYLQKTVLGNNINNLSCEYWFNPLRLRLGIIKKVINKFLFLIKIGIQSPKTYFFTHDIETASLLAKMGKKYSLVYHNQGPVVEEGILSGKIYSVAELKRISKIERLAFINAQTLHFPSLGAADMYFKSQYACCEKNETNIYAPLYNIILPTRVKKTHSLNLEKDDRFITLFSLGTLTSAKGQDQTIDFIRKYVTVSPKPLRYIIVGKGVLKMQLLSSLELIKKEKPDFEYFYFDVLSHNEVMYIHQITDIYIMLHRLSIFDFATLEAMSQKCAIILSKVGGNLDFQKENNIIYAEDIEKNINLLREINIDLLKDKNYNVFCRYFSETAFKNQYQLFFEKVVSNLSFD